jgi:uncharacterized protein DUF3168
MLISDVIFSQVTTDAKVQALIGDRAYPSLAPKETKLPYLVFFQISGEPVESLAGTNRLSFLKYRFACYGSNFRNAKVLASAVKNCLNGWFATMSDGSQVQGTHQILEMDDSEAIPQGTIYSTHLDFNISYLEQN